MVRFCAFPNCNNKMRRHGATSFHRLPLRNIKMLKLWLLVLQKDVNTPVHALRLADYRVCSDHFEKEDYSQPRKNPSPKHLFLKKTAVPRARSAAAVGVEVQTINLKEEPNPIQIVQYGGVPVRHNVTRDLKGNNIFASNNVLVETQCLLELFQLCCFCHQECCITVEGHERMFTITQDCQSCGYQREWRNHSTPPNEPAESSPHEPTYREEVQEDDIVHKDGEQPWEPKEEYNEEIVVEIESSDHEGNEQGYEKMFIETDGSNPSGDEDLSMQDWNGQKIKRWKSKSQDGSDNGEPHYEEASDSEVSVDDEDHLKLLMWCTECKNVASLSCALHRHKKLFYCSLCCNDDDDDDSSKVHDFNNAGVTFDDFTSFQEHSEKEHGVKPFHKVCQDCGVLVNPDSEGKMDHVCEHKPKPVICAECGKSFLTESGLKTHCTKIHKTWDHPCKYCLKVFRTRESKVAHEQTHPKEKYSFLCPDCPLKFCSHHKRNLHLKSHRGPYKYLCDVCGKGFNDIMKLKRHKLVHSGEKPYKCQVCGRSFNQMQNLNCHMRIHTGEKPFMCETCGECFNHKSSLKNHKLRHHLPEENQQETKNLDLQILKVPNAEVDAP